MPLYVKKILSRLRNAGFEAYAVGGCVRDSLLMRRPKDWDITTSAATTEVERIFRKTAPTGINYGTVTVFSGGGKCEVTTFRTDGAYRDNRKPESVTFVSDLCEDLSRRDFTVNAMAMDCDGAITDLFGGRDDLRARILRTVGDAEKRFSEDALRMLRCLRFSAELGFRIEAGTLAAIKKLAPNAASLSAERVRDEIGRLLASPRPEKLSELIALGLLEAYGAKNADFSGISRLPKRGYSRWCAFAALSGGGAELLHALRLPAYAVKLCDRAIAASEGYSGNELEILADFGPEATEAAGHILTARGVKNRLKTAPKLTEYVPENALKLTGDDLISMGFRGAEIGKIKRGLARKVTMGQLDNTSEALVNYLEGMVKNET